MTLGTETNWLPLLSLLTKQNNILQKNKLYNKEYMLLRYKFMPLASSKTLWLSIKAFIVINYSDLVMVQK